MRRLPLLACCPLLLALLLGACAAPTVQKQVLAPAPAEEVARLTRLKVAAFDNDENGQVRAAVEGALASVTVDGRPYFAMVGPGASAGSLGQPMQWVSSGKASARPIRYGSEGTVQGRVERNGWTNEHYYEKRRECVAEDAHGACVLWANRNIQCTRRVARFSFTPRVVAKDTGAVLLSQEFTESGQSSACADRGAPASGESLLAAARAKAIARFRNHVSPHMVTLDIPLLSEDDSGMNSQTKALVAGGVDFAKAGQPGKACQVWRSAAQGHEAGYALPYLSGVCAELQDEYDQAEGFYTLAQSRSTKPVPEIASALARIKSARADQDRLEQQRK